MIDGNGRVRVGEQPADGGAIPLTVHTLLPDDDGQDDGRKAAFGLKQPHGDPSRMPVMVLAPAPPWEPPARSGGRRPVVAVPDTGVEPHPWLAGTPGDPVVRDAADFGWTAPPGRVGDGPFRGHATFVAGVIRQTAPQARILSVGHRACPPSRPPTWSSRPGSSCCAGCTRSAHRRRWPPG